MTVNEEALKKHENENVREMVAWFLKYYEPSDEPDGTPYIEERLLSQFRARDHRDINRAYELLRASAKLWKPLPASKPDRPRPPPFIWLKGLRGYYHGYFRADRIEAVFATRRKMAVPNDPTCDELVECTQVSMFNRAVLTEETPDEIFAKMADALRIPQKDEP